MILAKDVLTESDELKQRDADILNAWLYEGITQRELGIQYEMTRDNVAKILSKNRSILKIDKQYTKIKRIHELHKQLHRTGDTKKDRIEVLEQLRKEDEGDSNISFISNFLVIDKPINSNPNRLDAFLADK